MAAVGYVTVTAERGALVAVTRNNRGHVIETYTADRLSDAVDEARRAVGLPAASGRGPRARRVSLRGEGLDKRQQRRARRRMAPS